MSNNAMPERGFHDLVILRPMTKLSHAVLWPDNVSRCHLCDYNHLYDYMTFDIHFDQFHTFPNLALFD